MLYTKFSVQEQATAHYNCSTLQGVELENQGGSGTASSHWEQRIFGVIMWYNSILINTPYQMLHGCSPCRMKE